MNIIPKQPAGTVDKLLRCNEVTSRFGLSLSIAEARALAETQSRALKTSERVAFTSGFMEDLIMAFCDSPYINQDDYAEIMAELTTLFYDFKNETLDEIDDAEAIALMKKLFDTVCEGSLDRLREYALPIVTRRIRFGLPPEPVIDENAVILEEEYDQDQ